MPARSRRCSLSSIRVGGLSSRRPSPVPGGRSTDVRLERGADVVLIEVESRIQALEQIIREGACKRAAISSSMPGDRRVHVVLAIPDTAHHRALIAAHPRIIGSAFPIGSELIRPALSDPAQSAWPGDGILQLPSGRGTPSERSGAGKGS